MSNVLLKDSTIEEFKSYLVKNNILEDKEVNLLLDVDEDESINFGITNILTVKNVNVQKFKDSNDELVIIGLIRITEHWLNRYKQVQKGFYSFQIVNDKAYLKEPEGDSDLFVFWIFK